MTDPQPVSTDAATDTAATDTAEADTTTTASEPADDTVALDRPTDAPTAAENTAPPTQTAASPESSDGPAATNDGTAPQLPATGAVTPPSAPSPAPDPGPASRGGGADFDTVDAAGNRVGNPGASGKGGLRDGGPGLGGGTDYADRGAQGGGLADGTATGPIGADGPRDPGKPAAEGATAPQLTSTPPAPPLLQLFPLAIEQNTKGGAVATLVLRHAGKQPAFEVSDARFEVVGDELRLKKGVALDYETEPSLELTLTVTTADGKALSATVTIQVTDVNEAPTEVTLSTDTVAGYLPGAVVGTLTTVDPDHGDSHTYSVDDARFEIVGSELRLKSWAALDPAAEPTLTLEVTTTDAGGLDLIQSFMVEVTPAGGGSFVVPLNAEFRVNTDTDGSQQLRSANNGGKSAAALADGGYVVTWRSSDGDDDHSIRSQRFDAGGQPAGDETTVEALLGSSYSAPIVTGLADGGHLVAWVQQSGEDVTIHGRFYDPAGLPTGPAAQLVDVTFESASWTSIAVSGFADGGFVITWGDWYGGSHEQSVGAQRFDATGNSVGNPVELGWWAEKMEVATLADGGHVINRSDMMWSTVYVFDAGGDLVHEFHPYFGYYTMVSALADGGFVLVQMGWNNDISAQRYDAAGVASGDSILVADGVWTSQFDVAGLTDGGFVVTWQTDNDVFGRVIDTDGAAVGEVFQAHDETLGTQTRPHVVGLNDSTFAIVWDGQGPGDDQGVFSRVFAVNSDQELVGTSGDDTLIGGNGDDLLVGMEGDDLLDGGGGDNILVDGPGADVFRFSTTGGTDTIADFSAAEGDILRIDLLLYDLAAVTGDSLEGYFELSFANGSTTLRIDTSGQSDFAEPDKTIVVEGVDLVGGADQAQALTMLLAAGQLEVAAAAV